ncbi:MAG: methyltransferase domain-containing protein [Proteobacteria bacterium]|nr:methyltransferase domain-containing protein [Pseudomonadota bacterium]
MPQSVPIEWAKHFLKKIDLANNQTILELGCRQGKVSAQLAQAYPDQNFIATDNIASELEHAKALRLPNLDFMLQDARHLLLEQQFDTVVSFNNCLMWIKEKQKVLKSIYTVLKPGAKAYLQFFVRHGYPKNDRFLSRTAAELEWRSHLKSYTQDYYDVTIPNFCQLLYQEGFVIHKLELMKYATHFEHYSLLQQFFGSWASQLKYIPIHKQDTFLNKATKNYMNHHCFSFDKPFDYFEFVLEVVCEKPLFKVDENATHFQYGPITFSRREAQVLKHLLSGKSAKEMGVILELSAKTIEFHLANIKEKTACSKRSDLFKLAWSEGFISLMFDNRL